MIKAIETEIDLQNDFIDPLEKIETIYFGGGTPSLLEDGYINQLIENIYKKFSIASDAEITLEANPDNISSISLNHWAKSGINRLSVGIQSFSEEELKWMNRAHNALQSIACLELINNSDIKDFSADLIYGTPLQTDEDVQKNAEILFNMQVPHISCYALTVEPKTALASMISKLKSLPIDDEKQSRQFLLLMNLLRHHGYEHYEISNFAKPGCRSRHNSSYWKGNSYYGIGPSAHSFNGKNKRRWNIANNSLYISSINKNEIPFTEEVLTISQQHNEYIMISLRTTDGINVERLKKDYGEHAVNELSDKVKKHMRSGYIKIEEDHIRLTDTGKLMADGIAADLFTDEIFAVP